MQDLYYLYFIIANPDHIRKRFRRKFLQISFSFINIQFLASQTQHVHSLSSINNCITVQTVKIGTWNSGVIRRPDRRSKYTETSRQPPYYRFAEIRR